MPTPYSEINAQFSNDAHMAARTILYPLIFGIPAESLSFVNTQLADGGMGEALDGMFGVDRIIKVRAVVDYIRQPLSFTVQERFRRPDSARWKDITITEWNTRTNQPSELYKLMANIFVYGYWDTQAQRFIDALAVDIQKTLRLLVRGNLRVRHGENPRSEQTFIAVTFADLYAAQCVIYWQNEPTKQSRVADNLNVPAY